MNLRAVVKGAEQQNAKIMLSKNAFLSQNAEVCTTILTQMLLSLFPTSKARVSGIGIAKKLKQNSYNAPEYKQQQKIQKDLGGAL